MLVYDAVAQTAADADDGAVPTLQLSKVESEECVESRLGAAVQVRPSQVSHVLVVAALTV